MDCLEREREAERERGGHLSIRKNADNEAETKIKSDDRESDNSHDSFLDSNGRDQTFMSMAVPPFSNQAEYFNESP